MAATIAAAAAAAAGSATSASAGACSSFRANLYRPALCVGCFKDIAEHYPGVWKVKVDFATGRRVYVNTQSGAVLNPRPGDVAPEGDGGSGGSIVHNPLAEFSAAGNVVEDRVSSWTTFAANLESKGGSGGGKDARSKAASGGKPARPPSVIMDAVRESPLSTAGLLSPSEHVPDLPSAVPQTALKNMAINLQALTAAMGGGSAHSPVVGARPSDAPAAGNEAPGFKPAPPPPRANPMRLVAPSAEPVLSDASVVLGSGRPGLPAPPQLPPLPPPADALLAPRPPPRKSAEAAAPPSAASQSPATGGGAIVTSPLATLAAILPVAAAQPPVSNAPSAVSAAASSSSSAPPALAPDTVDLSVFLAPLYDDPLLVDLAALSAHAQSPSSAAAGDAGPTAGVTIIPIKQPFEESFSVPRFLVVTPFTIMALAAHPTRPGYGILKWERSLLSLRHLATQPLIRKTPQAGGGSGTSAGVLGFFRKRAGSEVGQPSESPLQDVGGGFSVYGVGVLASFAGETTDTITFLRTYRAGRRPVVKEGTLHKRKKAAWRERAPLGPLAWKKRWFVLSATCLTYYTTAPSNTDGSGAEDHKLLKGEIPLTGWVEVARVDGSGTEMGGGGGGTGGGGFLGSLGLGDRKHSFIVRTGTTYHVFSAPSAAEADEWVAAISINAQHVGATQHDPQCLELPSPAVASDVAAAIVKRRRFLVESMSLRARAELGDAGELHLDIMNELLPHRPRSLRGLGGGRRGEYGGEAFYDDGALVDPAEQIEGMTVGEAWGFIDAAGGPSAAAEVLAQLPTALASAVRRYQRQLEAGIVYPGPGGGGSGGDFGGAASPASPGASTRAALAALPPGVGAWYYLDDSDAQQGPFPDPQMRDWLFARYFGPSTLIRHALPVPELDPSCAVDAEGVPQTFLPISALFSDPSLAFTPDGSGVWLPSYRDAVVYQNLVQAAVAFGVQRERVGEAVLAMRAANIPPELSLLLDVCGVTSLQQQ